MDALDYAVIGFVIFLFGFLVYVAAKWSSEKGSHWFCFDCQKEFDSDEGRIRKEIEVEHRQVSPNCKGRVQYIIGCCVAARKDEPKKIT